LDITQLRKDFIVFVVDKDPASAQSLAETLHSTGYENARSFATLEAVVATVNQDPPHILLLGFETEGSDTEDLLGELQKASPETLTILITQTGESEFLQALSFVSRSLAYDTVSRPFVSMIEVIQKMDRAASRLYYQFESEQLREHYENGGTATGTELLVSDFLGFNDFLERFILTRDLDQTVQTFLESLSRSSSDAPVLYFKYLPSHMSLLFAQAALLPADKFRGVGVDLKGENPVHISDILSEPTEIKGLKKLIFEIFKNDKFSAFAHRNEENVLGVIVILSPQAEVVDVNSGRILSLRRIFDLAYKRNLALKERHAVDITDSTTGLANRRQFMILLDEEIARSRRILMPTSLIMINIDGFNKLNEKIGFQQADTILWTIGTILKKTTRTNDVLARVGADDFVCLLPHTPFKGAAIKAERIRRMIEATRIPLLESFDIGSLHISCGVSEYPSFCSGGDSLLQTADEALDQVKKSGGNRVCLASAPENFQMDFVPREPEVSPK
jgi:diguanylate cyclase (GGDEF)-like protein